MNKLISGAIGLEIKISSDKTRFYLPDNSILRNKRIKHIDYCKLTDVSNAPSGREIAYLDNNLDITFVEANTQNELIQHVPLTSLSQNGNRLFINKIIDFQRSYITINGTVDPMELDNKSNWLSA